MKTLLRRSWQAFLLSAVLIISLAIQPSTVIASTDLPDCVNSDCNCSDFTTQEAAQNVLTAFEGDRFRLDRDKDGIACESLPRASADTADTVVLEGFCPHKIFTQADWYTSEPKNLTDSRFVSMFVELRNKSGKELNFDSDPNNTLQLWTYPEQPDGNLFTPNYKMVVAPSGKVSPDETFTYYVNMYFNNAPPETTEIGFAPKSKDFLVNPEQAVLEFGDFDCE